MYRIKDLPLSDRPQEKILSKGPENLTNIELVAILLGTGSKRKNALGLAKQVLQSIEKKETDLMLSKYSHIPGVGRVKTARIAAAIELGKRIFSPASITKVFIKTNRDAIVLASEIAAKKQEFLMVLYLNARGELIRKEIVSLGRLNSTYVEPREIFSLAVSVPSAAIVLLHNHPSGDPTPSDEDILFTKRIQQAGVLMGVVLFDHLVIGFTKYFSFQENAFHNYDSS